MNENVLTIQPKDITKPRKRNVCAYARVSSEKEANTTSFESQIEVYTEMIKNNPEWNYCGVYADEGLTGTSMNNRTQLNLMLHRARSGLIDLIITKSISRLSRDTLDTISIIREMTTHGVEIYFETQNLSTLDPKVETLITMIAGQAQEEASSVSKNCRWSLKKRYANGDAFFNTRIMIGLDRNSSNEIYIVEDEAVAVRKIYDMYVKREKLEDISNWLELNCFKTGTGKTTWTRSSIMAILRNEKYVGDMLLQKRVTKGVNGRIVKNRGDENQYLVKNNHPAIIDREIWELAQLIRTERITKYNCSGDERKIKKLEPNKSIYSSFVICGECNKSYNYRTNNSGNKWEKTFLTCSANKLKRQCNNETIPTDVIDQIIIELCNSVLNNKQHFFNLLKKGLSHLYVDDPRTEELDSVYAQIESLENQLEQAKDKNDVFFTRVKHEINKELAQLVNKKLEIENTICSSFDIDMFVANTKNLIRPYERVTDVKDIPFKLLFSKLIIKNRNELIFIIGNPRKTEYNLESNTILNGTHEWILRKLKIKTKFSIMIQ